MTYKKRTGQIVRSFLKIKSDEDWTKIHEIFIFALKFYFYLPLRPFFLNFILNSELKTIIICYTGTNFKSSY